MPVGLDCAGIKWTVAAPDNGGYYPSPVVWNCSSRLKTAQRHGVPYSTNISTHPDKPPLGGHGQNRAQTHNGPSYASITGMKNSQQQAVFYRF